jgi:hypothetical protein
MRFVSDDPVRARRPHKESRNHIRDFSRAIADRDRAPRVSMWILRCRICKLVNENQRITEIDDARQPGAGLQRQPV